MIRYSMCTSSSNYRRFVSTIFVDLSILLVTLAVTNVASTDQATRAAPNKPPINRLLVVTIATKPNHEAFKRFNRSIDAYKHELIVLGADSATLNNNNNQDDRIDLLRKALAVYKNEQELVVMVVDSYNLIINGDKNDILSRFTRKFKPTTRLVFSADAKCWPDESLESKYPAVATNGGGERFLNSDAFIGYAPALWDLLNLSQLSGAVSQERKFSKQSDKWQLYFTSAYLDAETRQRLAIELDHKAELFQNLHSIESEVEIEFDTDSVKLKNSAYSTEPVVVHETGSRSSKVILNSLGNYLGKAWTVRDGCRHCNETSVSSASREVLPLVLLGIFVEEPTPFFDEFLETVHKLNYPRDRMHLFIHSSTEYHDHQVQSFIRQHGSQYASQQVATSYNKGEDPEEEERRWRAHGLDKCKQLSCDYYLALDSVARLDEPDSLRLLIETNRTIVAPMLSRPAKLWSNFWGSITSDGFYARSHDYVSLVKRERRGVWNVPQLMNAYLVEGSFIRAHLPPASSVSALDETGSDAWQLSYREPELPRLKPILAFSHRLRAAGAFQFVTNMHEFGHLVDPTSFNTSVTHPDFYQLKENMLDWEHRYLHENYSKLVEGDYQDDEEFESTALKQLRSAPANGSSLMEEPCQDVYWFPLVNDLFCKQLIEIMEAFGRWSGGTNNDPRIEGGYESVPTRDIHFRQVGLHDMWLLFLREYIMPIQLKQYIGYEHDPPRTDLAFVVRYHPEEQPSLRPHHDSSTYTLNIALNSPGVDYTGGGCRFVRYNCSVVDSRKGWALIHPGRLTHYHEGLPVTNGTRYIMVTFVDP